MTNVYVCSVGEYSDNRIVAVVSTEEIAEELERLTGCYVEQFVLDDVQPDRPPAGANAYYVVELGKNGEMARDTFKQHLLGGDGWRDWDAGFAKLLPDLTTLRTSKDSLYERKSFWRLTVGRYGRSEEHVVKIASDLWRQIQAGQRPPCVDFGKN